MLSLSVCLICEWMFYSFFSIKCGFVVSFHVTLLLYPYLMIYSPCYNRHAWLLHTTYYSIKWLNNKTINWILSGFNWTWSSQVVHIPTRTTWMILLHAMRVLSSSSRLKKGDWSFRKKTLLHSRLLYYYYRKYKRKDTALTAGEKRKTN